MFISLQKINSLTCDILSVKRTKKTMLVDLLNHKRPKQAFFLGGRRGGPTTGNKIAFCHAFCSLLFVQFRSPQKSQAFTRFAGRFQFHT